jgi:tripartite-type tricarboxylate transporter receptor subunit TctC
MRFPVLLILAVLAAPLSAQDYPNRPVRLVSPFAVGGGSDVWARIMAPKLSERWGQSVVVENRVGASGNLAADYVAKATPDGYTLVMAGTTHAIGKNLFQSLSYDLEKDLTPITAVVTYSSVIVASTTLSVTNVKELIALAKAKPGQLDFGSGNVGSANHLSMELFKLMAKIDMIHIPYKGGSGQLIGDLVAGHVKLASMGIPLAIGQINAGKLRALAVTGTTRSQLLPEVPTVSESGLPGFEITSFDAVFGPAGLSSNLVAKLNRDIVAVLDSPDAKARFAALDAVPAPMTPDALARYLHDQVAMWGKLVQASGAKATD